MDRNVDYESGKRLFEQRVEIDDINVSELYNGRNRVGRFHVSFRVVKTGQYFGRDFKIRDRIGNVTVLGRKMGIKTRDRRISIFSQRGQTIERYLNRLAWKYAGSLARGEQKVRDDTGFRLMRGARRLAS